jgi:hypothetical protein
MISLIFGVSILASSCASTKLTHTWVEETNTGKSFSNFLVIGVSDREGVRRSYEEKFVDELKRAGVKAVSSAGAIDIPANQKLENEKILEVVQIYGNDAVVVTHLIGVEKEQVYHPPTISPYGYYGYYNRVYGTVHRPGYYTTQTFVRLETNVYDVKTEKLVWSGQSETWQPGSEKQIIDEVVPAVIRELERNNLIRGK